MSEQRELILYRHAETLRITSSGTRIPDIGELSSATREGRKLRADDIDLTYIGTSEHKRTMLTANFIGMIKAKSGAILPNIVTYDFLNENIPNDYTRQEFLNLCYSGRIPAKLPTYGATVLEKLEQIDSRINLCVTHGSVLAAIISTKDTNSRIEVESPGNSFIVPPLGKISVKFASLSSE